MTEISPLDLFLERAKILDAMDDPIDFPLQDDDYTVSSYPKTGTTWIQQIVHQLRTGGDENFREISLVIPYLMPEHLGDQLGGKTPYLYRPRVFKTHSNYEHIVPQGGKHIYVVRNPEDTLLSNYHFVPSFAGIQSGVSIEDFYFRYYRDTENPNYWRNLLSWWQHKDDGGNKILFLHFEDLKENLEHCIRHIAKFLKIDPLDEELLKLVLHRASFQYMKENSYLFDARFELVKMREVLGVPIEEKYLGKVREGGGQVGQGEKFIPENVRDDLRKTWNERIAPLTGCETYDELRATTSLLRKPL